jgi:hypothetical protein
MECVGAASIRTHLVEIEHSLDSGQYRVGQWARLIRDIRALPQDDRAAIAGDVSRVSRKLHHRHHYLTIPFAAAFTAEIVMAVGGGICLALGIVHQSNLLVIVAAAFWSIAFQPLIKVSTGLLLGISYDYAYLYHVEPRFKTSYGTYLAAPRSSRIIFHLSGVVGSPLGVWLPALWATGHLNSAFYVCRGFFWLFVIINAGTLLLALAGPRKLGGFRFRDSSAGMAALEIREALGA